MKPATLLVTFVLLLVATQTVFAQSNTNGISEETSTRNEYFTTSIQTPLINTLYAVTFSSSASSTNLYTISSTDGVVSYVGNVGISNVTDVEFYGNELYAITFNQFIQIDLDTGKGKIIGAFGYDDMSSLVVSTDGTPYAASGDGSLISISRRTGQGSLVGKFGSGLYSSGDMAFNVDRILYASVGRNGYTTDWLATIDLNTGKATLIGSIGYDDVWGLAFKDGQLYGVTGDRELLRINIANGAGTVISTSGLQWAGMTISPTCLEVVDGICIISDLEHSYIARIDLSNPYIKVELAHEFADSSTGLFQTKTVKKFVKNNSGAGQANDIAHYYVAINGTAKESEFGNSYSKGAILGINGKAYGHQCVGGKECIDQPKASFFPFTYTLPLTIKRAGGIDFPEDNENDEDAKEFIQNAISSSLFTVGYQSSILDIIHPDGTIISNRPEYVASTNDDKLLDEKTALGISLDGTKLFLAVVDSTVSTQELSARLKDQGAARAILLDGGFSSQFASYAVDGVDRNYEAKKLYFVTRHDLNAIVVYNSSLATGSEIAIVDSGKYNISPNITITIDKDTFNTPVNLHYSPQFPDIDDSFRHVERFFEMHAQDSSGTEVQPQKPYQIVVSYQETAMPLDLKEKDLNLYFWDGFAWILEPTADLDTARNIVMATPSHFSRWAILGKPTYEIYLPIIDR